MKEAVVESKIGVEVDLHFKKKEKKEKKVKEWRGKMLE